MLTGHLKTRATDMAVMIALALAIVALVYVGWTWLVHIHSCP